MRSTSLRRSLVCGELWSAKISSLRCHRCDSPAFQRICKTWLKLCLCLVTYLMGCHNVTCKMKLPASCLMIQVRSKHLEKEMEIIHSRVKQHKPSLINPSSSSSWPLKAVPDALMSCANNQSAGNRLENLG